MKRINNRGVILLETLIVCVFIMSISIFIYRNAVPLIGEYEKLESFDDVDSVYAANLIKNLVVSNISFDDINDLLMNNSYIDISDCEMTKNDGTPLYIDVDYCKKIKNSLNMNDDDIIYITGYNYGDLTDFRSDMKDSNKKNASRFNDYLKTVSNSEAFYAKNSGSNNVIALYRVFISRNVNMMDGTSIKKFANIGIYKNKENN